MADAPVRLPATSTARPLTPQKSRHVPHSLGRSRHGSLSVEHELGAVTTLLCHSDRSGLRPERRQENKRQLVAMLHEEQRFKETDAGYRLTLSAPQVEWLLQLLNDIRVGSWLILGEPDEKKGKPVALTSENARHYAAMEFCGLFQMTLLDAVQQGR